MSGKLEPGKVLRLGLMTFCASVWKASRYWATTKGYEAFHVLFPIKRPLVWHMVKVLWSTRTSFATSLQTSTSERINDMPRLVAKLVQSDNNTVTIGIHRGIWTFSGKFLECI